MVKRPNVIAVMSPKGGVGKTVTTANLAAALAIEFNKKVLAIDTNISTASLGLHLDLYYPKRTMHDILEKKFKVKDIIHPYHENLHLIPASIKIKKRDKNPRNVQKNIRKIVKFYDEILKELHKEYDLVLLDCSPGFDLEALAAMQIAGGLLLITNPDMPSIVTAVKAVEYAKSFKIPVGGVVLNKVRNKKYELSEKHIEDLLNIKVVEKIPFNNKIPESIAKKIPIVLFKPRNKSSKAYKRLAATMIGEVYKPSFWKKPKKK
jgi:MinD-like ATPase involved in chromosome partitioning or flagellar assembly